MAVSRRLRYEILRRDNHACRYCGATAPETPLTVDHVIPTALGGTDEPTNLVAACGPCNSGKSATPPGAPLVADVARDALRWSWAMRATAEVFRRELDVLLSSRQYVDRMWLEWTDELPAPRPPDWPDSVDRFVAAGMTPQLMSEAIRKAMVNRRISPGDKWRYFCGIAWRQISEMQDVARQVAAGLALDEESG
jgi:hypothetical protein